MNKLKLKWRIFAFLLGFCALLLIILWLFQTVFITEMYRFIRQQELNQAIAQVEKEINNPNLQNILYDIFLEKEITSAPTKDFVPPARFGFNEQGRPGDPMRNVITEEKVFTLAGGQTVSWTFYAMIAPVQATVTTLRYQLYLISAIMLILAVFLAIIIAKRVSKPIEDISLSALTLAKGNYSTHFEGKGFREIVTLSETLNTAAVELGKAEGLRRELLANVSHDLRTPLALIYSYAEMMHDFPDEITPEQTKMIMDETQRLTTLVNDVLDISKLENEMENLNCSHFNLTGCILEITERTGELLKKDGFTISFDHCGNIYVNADKTKIGRAFYNLLVNAVNYSGDSREITVTQTIIADCVRIGITDNGEGITETDFPFIWDRYYKSGKKHKRATAGTGLGLSIVKKIIELHDGRYGVTSEIGKGSTFWFELMREAPNE